MNKITFLSIASNTRIKFDVQLIESIKCFDFMTKYFNGFKFNLKYTIIWGILQNLMHQKYNSMSGLINEISFSLLKVFREYMAETSGAGLLTLYITIFAISLRGNRGGHSLV